MNSPVDPALLQLVQQEVKSLQDDVNNMSVEFGEEKIRVQHELEQYERILEEVKQRVRRLEDKVDDFQGDCLIGNIIFFSPVTSRLSFSSVQYRSVRVSYIYKCKQSCNLRTVPPNRDLFLQSLRLDLSKGYCNPKRKMWVTTHFSEITEQP